MPERIVADVLFIRNPDGTITIEEVGETETPLPEGQARCQSCFTTYPAAYVHTCKECYQCCHCTFCSICYADTTAQHCSQCYGCPSHCMCITCPHCGAKITDQSAICVVCNRGVPCGCCTGNGIIHFREAGVKLTKYEDSSAVSACLSPRLAACEIEVAAATRGTVLDATLNKWHCAVVADGSLPNGGFEINTHPASGAYFLDEMRQIAGALATQGAVVNEKCGCHVHINARDFTFHDISKLIHLYAALEPGIYGMLPSRRQSNRYCVPFGIEYFNRVTTYLTEHLDGEEKVTRRLLRQAILTALYGTTKIAAYRKTKGGGGNLNRYRGINLHSWCYRGTVEFRFPPGTVKYTDLVGWGQFLAATLDMAKQMELADILAFGAAPLNVIKTEQLGVTNKGTMMKLRPLSVPLIHKVAERAGQLEWVRSKLHDYANEYPNLPREDE